MPSAYLAMVNHAWASEVVERAAGMIVGASRVDAHPAPTMGAEDFAFFTRAVPGALWRLGLCPPGRADVPKLHQPDFDFPDSAIPIGVAMHCTIAQDVLSTGLPDGAWG